MLEPGGGQAGEHWNDLQTPYADKDRRWTGSVNILADHHIIQFILITQTLNKCNEWLLTINIIVFAIDSFLIFDIKNTLNSCMKYFISCISNFIQWRIRQALNLLRSL